MRRLVVVAMLVSGCAGMGLGTKADGEAEHERQRIWESHLQSRMGMNVTDIIAVAGPPMNATKLPNGDSIYTWGRYGQPVTSSYTTPIGYGNYVTNTRTNQLYCRVDYTVGADNVAKSWRWEGNACY